MLRERYDPRVSERAPGWYPDPTDDSRRAYWDGRQWHDDDPPPALTRKQQEAKFKKIAYPIALVIGVGFIIHGCNRDASSSAPVSAPTSTETSTTAPVANSTDGMSPPSDSAQDTAYYLTLEHFGLDISHSSAASMGIALCSILRDPTETVAEAGSQLMAMNKGWTEEDAGHFLGAATTRYCPDKTPQ